MNIRQQCALMVKKATCAPGYINRSVASSPREVILSIYAAFMRLNLSMVSSLGFLSTRDIDKVSPAETNKMIEGLQNKMQGIVHPVEENSMSRI